VTRASRPCWQREIAEDDMDQTPWLGFAAILLLILTTPIIIYRMIARYIRAARNISQIARKGRGEK
jgi:hypothetical protein